MGANFGIGRSFPRSRAALAAAECHEDYERVVAHRWALVVTKGHVWVRSTDRKALSLPRFILNAGPDERIQTYDKDPTNCCRANLWRRPIHRGDKLPLRPQGRPSRTGIRYVHLMADGRYRVFILVNGKQRYFGDFIALEDAVTTRNLRLAELGREM